MQYQLTLDKVETATELQNFVPPVLPERLTFKHPVLGVRNLCTKMGTEPRRNRSHISLADSFKVAEILNISSIAHGRIDRNIVKLSRPGIPRLD